MENTSEISQDEEGEESKSYAVLKCEQGCLESAEKCEETVKGDGEVDACRSEFLKCVDSCQVLLSPST